MRKLLMTLIAAMVMAGVANAMTIETCLDSCADPQEIFLTVSDQEVRDVIDSSRAYNTEKNGIVDPSSMIPGQTFSAILDGEVWSRLVLAGDNQSSIVREMLRDYKVGVYTRWLEEVYFVRHDSESVQALGADSTGGNLGTDEQEKVSSIGTQEKFPVNTALLAFLVIGSILFFAHRLGSNGYVNPVDAGTPVVPGGIVFGHHDELMQVVNAFRRNLRRFAKVEQVRRCVISTVKKQRYGVKFVDAVHDLILQKEMGYAAIVDGEQRFLLADCGGALVGEEAYTDRLRVQYLDFVSTGVWKAIETAFNELPDGMGFTYRAENVEIHVTKSEHYTNSADTFDLSNLATVVKRMEKRIAKSVFEKCSSTDKKIHGRFFVKSRKNGGLIVTDLVLSHVAAMATLRDLKKSGDINEVDFADLTEQADEAFDKKDVSVDVLVGEHNN